MKKVTFSVQISQDLLEEIRNVAYWSPQLTLSKITQDALTIHISLLKKEGKNFESRPNKLKVGRRI